MSASLTAVLLFHITAGGFGLVSGGTALLSRKGAWLHRAAGNVFFIAMLLMAASGAIVAVLMPAAASLNGLVAAVTFYLVATSWVTIVRKDGEAGWFERLGLAMALTIGGVGLVFGFRASSDAKGVYDSIPAGIYFGFAAVGIAGAVFDISVIARRGVSGAQRIARHLWRMCVALLIASLAFFVGQAAVLPASVRDMKLNVVPLIIVLVLLLFWLVRVLFTGWYRRSSAVVEPAE